MKLSDLTTNPNHSFKFKQSDGKWTPHLTFVKEKDGKYIFKPYNDTESTLKVSVIHLYIASVKDVESGKHFELSPKYCTWEKLP